MNVYYYQAYSYAEGEGPVRVPSLDVCIYAPSSDLATLVLDARALGRGFERCFDPHGGILGYYSPAVGQVYWADLGRMYVTGLN